MKFFKKILFLTLLNCSISWAVSTEEFTKKTKLLLDEIISKNFEIGIVQEDTNKVLNFLQTQWKTENPDQKDFLTLMHTEIPFLGSLIKYASDYKYKDSDLPFMHFEDAALAFMQKGLSAYRRFKNDLAPGLDLSRLCLSEMGFNEQGSFLSSPVVEKIYPHMNKDGVCGGLSCLYALCSLPKDSSVPPPTLPLLPCLASLEQLQGFGKKIYPHLSENWFWENYNKLLCAKSLSAFPAQERSHMEAFLNLTHFFQNMQMHPLQEVMDYFDFPVTVRSQAHYGKLDDETIKSALEKDLKTKNPCILAASEHVTTLEEKAQKIKLYDPNTPSGLKDFSNTKEVVEDYAQKYDYTKNYNRSSRPSEWVYWNTLSAKNSSSLEKVGFKQKFLTGTRPTRKRTQEILSLTDLPCPIFSLCSLSELQMLFRQSNTFKVAMWDPRRGLYDKKFWGEFPGSVSKFYDFVMEQMNRYPNASAVWKIFKKIDSLTKSEMSPLHLSVRQSLPLSNDPKTWLKPNRGLITLAQDIEKATTVIRARCILEEYQRTL
jgi:hypothetical protein